VGLLAVVAMGSMTDEEKELQDLRKLIGDGDLDRLRPTGATSGVAIPGRVEADALRRQRQQKQREQDEDDLDFDEQPAWDSRSGRAAPVRAEAMVSGRREGWKLEAMSARREKYGSARYGSGRYHEERISRKAALEWYHRELEDHSYQWRARQETNAACTRPHVT
jgi:hypothetical protein